MLRAMLRDLRAHKGRVAMTLVAIVLGVTFVVATWVVSESVATSVTTGDRRTDVAVMVRPVEWKERISPEEKDRLATTPGATGASGVVSGRAQPVLRNGKVSDGWPEQTGTDWDTSSRFNLTSGRGPTKAGEVALEEKIAKEAGLRVGGTTKILLAEGRSDNAVVVGLFTYRPLSLGDMPPEVAYDEATALKHLDKGFTSVELTAAAGADHKALAEAVRKQGGNRFGAITGAELNRQAEEDAARTAGDIRNMLLSFAAVALLVGMFVIANTFTMLVAQRTRQFGLLRAVGARRRQVRRAILIESAVLGLVGATIGTALGVGLAIAGLYLLRPVGETLVYVVPPVGIVAGYLVGVGVTVLAAYGSARRGAAVAPIAALRTDATLPRRSYVVRTVLGLVAIAAGGAAIAATAGDDLSESEMVLGMAGALLAWVGVLLLAPLLVRAVLHPLATLLSRGGPVSRLALRNAVRDPRRTAATASALMIGLALVCAFATVGETFTSHMTSSTRAMVPASTTVVKASARWGSLDEDAVAKARKVPGASTVLVAHEGWANAEYNGKSASMGVTAVDPAAFGTVVRAEPTRGAADLRRGALISTFSAEKLKVKPGDRITMVFNENTKREITVAGVYEETGNGVLNGLVMDVAALPEDAREQVSGVYLTGSDPGAVRKAARNALRDRADVSVTDRDGLIQEIVKDVQLVLMVLYALLGAAVIIAVFGVVNTLALSVIERTREIGVLRAVGATRRLVRRAVRLESVVIATYGGLLGVGVGLALGGVMQHLSLRRPLWDIAVPYVVTGAALAGMVIVGVLAAVWPARRAARTDVLAAIATE